MSIDTHTELDAHGHGGHDGGHHEPPEVVDGRQRMAIWLFIGGDIITTSAMIFTYLYLRGVNMGGHWRNMVGYPGPQLSGGHTYAYYQNAASLPNPMNIHVPQVSVGLNWTVTLIAIVSALLIWAAERVLRSSKNAKSYSSLAALGTVVVFMAFLLSIKQAQHLPQVYQSVNDSQVMAYSTYSSCMMMIIGNGAIHYALLTFLGLGLTIRSARGVINGDKWYQARLVRLFWVWTAVSGVAFSLLTSTIR